MRKIKISRQAEPALQDDSQLKAGRRPMYAAGLIERAHHEVLIVRSCAVGGDGEVWQLPRGLVNEKESAEAAFRRIAKETLGLTVDILVGQPPVVGVEAGREMELRYFLCAVIGGEVRKDYYDDVRWVAKDDLLSFEFDEYSLSVVQWWAC